jgi:hypothetical protein
MPPSRLLAGKFPGFTCPGFASFPRHPYRPQVWHSRYKRKS